jgi:hypothetical protein
MLAGVALLPVAFGASMALAHLLRASGTADTIWAPLLAGAACWLVIFLLLPKPMLIYVFGHELTHAVWTWMFGGKVKRFKASSSGGHVVVTKDNFLISLAPYFCPLYAILVIAIFAAGCRWLAWERHIAWFHLVLGAAYSFHLTLTFHILKTRQSDITSQGYLFSAVIIFLGNMVVLLLGLPLLTAEVPLTQVLHWWWDETQWIIRQIVNRAGNWNV